jgi:glycosyltransferase involved in cell wall biosynthesis
MSYLVDKNNVRNQKVIKMKQTKREGLPRILCVLQLPPPVHGASLMNSYLVNSDQLREKYEIDLINLQFASSMKDLKKFSFKKIFKALLFAFEIVKKISTKKPELVYFALSPFGYAFYRDAIYVTIFKLLKVKVLFHLHGKGIKPVTQHSLVRRWIYKGVFKNTNVICLTNKLTRDIDNVSGSSPFIVPCGIPIHPKSLTKKTESKKNVQILYLSNYVQSKGILRLIDALAIVRKNGRVFNARLVGAPTDLSVREVEAYISDRNLDEYIEVTGPRYGEDKYREFEIADIFVFPTSYPNEAFPLVNLEAMQFGIPVISTDEGGIAEGVINNETGYIVDPADVTQIAEKITSLIDNEELRRQMGNNGKERFLKHFTLDHFVCNMDSTFQEVLR